MILATLIGTVFWVTYRYLIGSMPVLIMNSLFGFIVLYQLFLKLKHEKPTGS